MSDTEDLFEESGREERAREARRLAKKEEAVKSLSKTIYTDTAARGWVWLWKFNYA